jgi:hypothetical protein
MGNDPEALVGVVDDGDVLLADRSDRVGLAVEFDGEVGVEAALEVNGQVQVQERRHSGGAQAGAFFRQSALPGVIGGEAGGAANIVLVVPLDLSLQEVVGGSKGGDFLIGQKGDQAVLEGAEAAFDFAFGGSVWSDAMGDAQGGQGALELGMSVQAVGSGSMAEKRQSVGVNAGGHAIGFKRQAEVLEMGPSGVAGGKGGGEDFAGVIIYGEDEGGVSLSGPPRMRGGIVLPEFADGGALPAAPGFGAGLLGGNQFGEMAADIIGDGGAGTMEAKAAGQFIRKQGEVERLTVGQDVMEVSDRLGGPEAAAGSAGRLGMEGMFVGQPAMAEAIELGRADHQSLGGGGGIQLAEIERGQDVLNKEGRNTVEELLFFFIA